MTGLLPTSQPPSLLQSCLELHTPMHAHKCTLCRSPPCVLPHATLSAWKDCLAILQLIGSSFKTQPHQTAQLVMTSHPVYLISQCTYIYHCTGHPWWDYFYLHDFPFWFKLIHAVPSSLFLKKKNFKRRHSNPSSSHNYGALNWEAIWS